MNAFLPVLILMTSLLPAGVIFFIPQASHTLRNTLNIGAAVVKLALVAWMLLAVAGGASYESVLPLAPGLVLLLRVDALALLFISLSATLWLLTTIYAIFYLGNKAELSRFFGFFSLCVAATTGLALSGSLISFFLFFELLTLSTWPLVAHKQDKASLAAARQYLMFALIGHRAMETAHHFCAVYRRCWGQGGAGAAAWLAALCHGRARAGFRAASRGCGGEGRCFWRGARGVRCVWRQRYAGLGRGYAARAPGEFHDPVGIMACARSG